MLRRTLGRRSGNFQPGALGSDQAGVNVYDRRMDTLIETLKWIAAGSGIVAALMVSLDLGRRITGWGFVLFAASSIAWITGSWLSEDWALGTQNFVLFGINLLGVYRYLIRKKAVD